MLRRGIFLRDACDEIDTGFCEKVPHERGPKKRPVSGEQVFARAPLTGPQRPRRASQLA
jgi:hypothetical protein